VDWHNFLRKWQEQGTIIELYSNLKQSYSTNYQLSEHELNAWRIMFRSIGCHNITFLKQESKVKKNKKNYFKIKKFLIKMIYCILVRILN
jgi:hypothetical protein